MSSKTDIYKSKVSAQKNQKKVKSLKSHKKRVRQPVTPSKGRVVGYFPSIKNGESIAWESQLELKACRIFEYSQFILGYREQPTNVYYDLQGVKKSYVPDFELICETGETLYVEIKPKHVLERPEEKLRYRAISNRLAEDNASFGIMTEVELEVGYIQDNLKKVLPYSGLSISADVIHILNSLKSTCIAKLLELGLSLASIYGAIAKNHLKANLSLELTNESILFTDKESTHENNLFSCRFAPDFE